MSVRGLERSWRFAAPLLVWIGLLLLPAPSGLSRNGWCYLALFAGVIAALVLEPLPPAAVGLLGVTVAALFGHVAPKSADSVKWALSGFSDSTVWLIFGSLTFSLGYEKTGLGRRIALALVRRMGGSTLGLGYAVALADLAIAPVTPSNTGRSAGVIYPIVSGIPVLYGSAPGPTARRIGAYLMWTTFAATAVTSSMFLTALAPNLLAVKLMQSELGIEVDWSRWMIGVLPVGVILIGLLPLAVYLVYPPEIRSSPDVPAWAAAELRRLGRISAREVVMGVLVLAAFLLWVLAGDRIHPTATILAAIALMVVLRVLDWEEIIGNRAAWDTMVYFATLMALADGLNHVGVVKWAAHGVTGLLAGRPPLLVLILLTVFFFIVHYAFASLTAHTVVVLPAILAAGAAFPGMPVGVFALVMGYSIGLMGVLTPYATGPAPVYFGSGFITRREFWLLGLGFGILFLATLLGIGLPYLLLVNP
ncbi:MAG: DASS family sodium-coupled anion symporter [Isosphaeraceae bacterium]